MNHRILKDLENAKILYDSLRLSEVYPLLKRFYDSLPFRYVPEHGEYFGMFVRTLYELGKESELQFYALELEKIAKKNQDPVVRYHTVYAMTELGKYPPNYAIKEVEEIIRVAEDETLRLKAKFLLAHLYDKFDHSADEMITLINHIEKPVDPALARFWETWQIKKLRFQKKFNEAIELIQRLSLDPSFQKDWYTFFNLKVYLCGTYLDMKEMEKAEEALNEIKKMVDEKPLKTCLMQFERQESRLWSAQTLSPINLKVEDNRTTISCGQRSFVLEEKNAAEKILSLMLKNGFVDKEMIIQAVYHRAYQSEKDDKLVYYHIYGVRDILNQVGLPRTVVESKDAGYQLKTQVILQEQL